MFLFVFIVMPNSFKSGTTATNGCIYDGNFIIGVDPAFAYGPTSTTSFYNGITPPTGGYTIYQNKAANGPSIRTAADDATMVSILQSMGSTETITIGAGGAAKTTSGVGNAGGTTTIGSLLSAYGGAGGGDDGKGGGGGSSFTTTSNFDSSAVNNDSDGKVIITLIK